jgi:hypothetical protein
MARRAKLDKPETLHQVIVRAIEGREIIDNEPSTARILSNPC